MSSRRVVLESKDLVAGYLPGVDILTGCNFKLYQGELVGIIGPNGAGKSTLVKSMFGLVEVRSGVVQLLNEEITNLFPIIKKKGLSLGLITSDGKFKRINFEDLIELSGRAITILKLKEKTQKKGKELFMPIRLALTGKTNGPELNKLILLMGYNKVMERLKRK